MIDHTRPVPVWQRINRTRLAAFLRVPELYTADGRLYRVVVVYRGTLQRLSADLARAGISAEKPREYPGLVGPVPSAEGVLFYALGSVVLCGAHEDLVETLETPGRLDGLLSAPAGRVTMTHSRPLPPPKTS